MFEDFEIKNICSEGIVNPVFKIIGEIADEQQIPCFVIGGYVRDLFLNRGKKDIDIVVVGSGCDFAQLVFQKLEGEKSFAEFKTYGTAQIKWNELELEFVGARKESYDRNSRNPLVEQGTLKDDQERRDFTINAMAISLNHDTYGELLDPFDGLADMDSLLIKTPLNPDITFSDDPLRMLRAVRFASQLGFDIDGDTYDALSRNAERLSIITQERITDELNKIILSPVPSIGFKLLFDTKLLHQFFPEMVALHGTETVGKLSHKDNFYHTLEVLDNTARKTKNLWLRWSAILHDIAKPATKRFEPNHGFTFHGHEDLGAKMTPKIFTRLRLPLDSKMRYVQKLVELHLRPIVLAKTEVTDSAVRRLLFEAGDDIDDLMILCESDITTKNPLKMKKYLQNFELVRKKLVEIEEKDKLRNFQPCITGDEIMVLFNLQPGREIGVLKTALKDAIVDGQIENEYNTALAYLTTKYNELRNN